MKENIKKKVVILGGGVAGMSAAHELVERGFDVEVYEYKGIPGGKARSIPKKGTGKGGRRDLPGEHGFRFFPGFYQHMPDTMKRIPYGGNEQGVFDNLVDAAKVAFARYDEPLVYILANFPRNLTQLKELIKQVMDNGFGLSKHDMEHAAEKLWQVMTSSEERRLNEYNKIAWWDFIEGDKQSEAFQTFFSSITRFAVAAKATEANTATIGSVAAQLVLEMITPGQTADRVLNGPTNDVWIYPWLEYLRQCGVDYHLKANVTSIQCVDGQITGAMVTEEEEDGSLRTYQVTGDYYIAALPVEAMAKLLNQDLLATDPRLESIQKLAEYVEWMAGIQFYLSEDVPVVYGHVTYMSSPWALTSISQAQFWPDFDLANFGDGSVKGILSVDISDWEAKGFNGKTAMECTAEELKQEVWEQLKRSLNTNGDILLRDDMIVDTFIDPDIVFGNPEQATVNLEPLLVNLVNTWELRPNAYTQIPNFFLASDYVRTNTDLATMEGANEAARRAVNCILEAAGSDEKPCKIWKMYEPDLLAPWRAHDRRRYEKGLPWDGGVL